MGAQNWAQHPRCGLTNAKQRGRITSLDQVNTLPNMAKNTLGFFCSKGALLTHVQLGVYQDPKSFSAVLFPTGYPQHVLVAGVVPPQVQDFALFEFHKVPVSPPHQPVRTPLDGNTVLW